MIVLSQINLHLGHTPRTSPGCSGPRTRWTRSQVRCGPRSGGVHRADHSPL